MTGVWQTRTLAQVTRIRPPKSEARARLPRGGDVSFLPMEALQASAKYINATSVRSLQSVAGSYTYFADGDVLLPKISPCFENGKMGIARNLANGIGFGSSEYIVFRPTSDITAEWLYYYLSRAEMRDEGTALTYGAVGQRRLPKEFVENYPIPVPSLPEQQRVVAILDGAFEGLSAARANAEKNLGNARAVFESYRDFVFTQDCEGWVEQRLEDVVEATCTLSYGIVQPGAEYAGGSPVVRPMDLAPKVIVPEGLKRIDPRLADSYQRTTLKGGELLLCVRGSTGAMSVASPQLAGANVTRGIVPIRFDSAVVRQDFAYYLMSSGAVQEQVRQGTYGAALMQINIRDLRRIRVSFPPLGEQLAIALTLASMEVEVGRLETIYQHKLAALDTLKQSLLHHAFSGQL